LERKGEVVKIRKGRSAKGKGKKKNEENRITSLGELLQGGRGKKLGRARCLPRGSD